MHRAVTEGKSPGGAWPGASRVAYRRTGPLPHLHPGPGGQPPAKGRQGHMEDHPSPHSGQTSRATPGFPGERTGRPAATHACRPGGSGCRTNRGAWGPRVPGAAALTLTPVLGSRLAVSINSRFHLDLSADGVLPESSPGCTYPSRLEVGREPAVLGPWAGGSHPPCARLRSEAPVRRAAL